MTLAHLGWNTRVAGAFDALADATLTPARIAREDRGRYLALGEFGERSAVLSGRLRHGLAARSAWPAVGDWVAVRLGRDGDAAIAAVLPRGSAFVRKAVGESAEEQVVAANVDTVFVVAGLDGAWNPRRLERYLVAAWDSGAEPVVVLNKADLADDAAARVAEMEALAMGAAVVALSALGGLGLDALAPWLAPGATVALIGSSGAGKSTLVNALAGEERQATQAVREADSRGRHTTTWRELVPLRGGAVLVDTPGMRELQLWDEGGDGLDGAFPDVAALAAACRFGDCAHAAEPGCAVREALASGALDGARFESWRKLQRELHWLATRRDARARAQEASRWKAITRSMKHHPKADRWR